MPLRNSHCCKCRQPGSRRNRSHFRPILPSRRKHEKESRKNRARKEPSPRTHAVQTVKVLSTHSVGLPRCQAKTVRRTRLRGTRSIARRFMLFCTPQYRYCLPFDATGIAQDDSPLRQCKRHQCHMCPNSSSLSARILGAYCLYTLR